MMQTYFTCNSRITDNVTYHDKLLLIYSFTYLQKYCFHKHKLLDQNFAQLKEEVKSIKDQYLIKTINTKKKMINELIVYKCNYINQYTNT